MLGHASICWATWKLRNRACFEKKNIKNPGEILYYACALMQYSAGLYPEDTQKVIAAGGWRGADDEDGMATTGEARRTKIGADAEGCT
jgi:hypothetical protein